MSFLFSFFMILPLANAQHLKVISEEGSEDLSRRDIQKRSRMYMVRVKDPIDGKGRAYHAIKVARLFGKDEWKKTKSVQFIAEDGMTVTIAAEKLDNPMSETSQAWLAYMPVDPKKGWPKTRSGKSIGPNYLIWKKPEKSGIKPEEWPFQITAVKALRQSASEMYPFLIPDKKYSKDSAEMKGYGVFLKNCFPCHTMNKKGPANLGPDLNFPHNPTEYWQEAMLKKYIRNPRGIRHWPKSKMPGFDNKEVSDQELDHLIQYLKHMVTRRS